MAVISDPPKLFGAYVVSVSTSLSWGSQGATSQFQLVEDPENGVIFTKPTVGTPAIFPGTGQTFGPFTPQNPLASGILQRWTYSESLSGRTYDVVIQSPAVILPGIQVILNVFNGTGSGGTLVDGIPGMSNILNVYAHYENFFTGGGFGDSAVNDLGFALVTYNTDGRKVDLLQTIVNMTASTGFSSFGNPIENAGYRYELDLRELYQGLKSRGLLYYRVSGDVIDLSSLINELSELLQYDWMIQLEDRGPKTLPLLKYKKIDRSAAPVLGVVAEAVKAGYATGDLVSANYGQELSTGTTTKVVVGAPVSRYTNSPIGASLPIWGRNFGDSWSVHPIGAGGTTTASVYTKANLGNKDYKFPLLLPNIGFYNVGLMELRMLTGGRPKESWQLFKTFQSIAEVEPNGYNGVQGLENAPWFSRVGINKEQLQLLADGRPIAIQDLQETSLTESQKRQDADREAELTQLFDTLKSVSDSFGRHFMVAVPADPGGDDENIKWINTYGDTDIKRYQYAWDVVSDAWVDGPVIARPDFYNNGRTKPTGTFVKQVSSGAWGSKTVSGGPFGTSRSFPFDFSEMGDGALDFNGLVYTLSGGPMEEEIYSLFGGYYVPSSVDNNPLAIDDWATPYFGISSLAKYFFDLDISPELYARPNSSDFIYEVPLLRVLPSNIGIPQQSNKYRYGPWFVTSGFGGATAVEFDDSLSPETFGGYTGLDQAGFAIAQTDVTPIGATETGFVEFVGVPEYNLGELFRGNGPYVTDLDVAVGTEGVKTTYKFNTYTPSFGKLARHNIELLARIGSSSFKRMTSSTVSYSTPVLGGTFGMNNAGARSIARNLSQAESRRRDREDRNRFGDQKKPDSMEFTLPAYEFDDGGGDGGGGGGGGDTSVGPATFDDTTACVDADSKTDTASTDTASFDGTTNTGTASIDTTTPYPTSTDTASTDTTGGTTTSSSSGY